MKVEGRQPYALATFILQDLFLVLISVKRLSRPQGYSAARRIMSMKNSSNTIGKQAHDLLACSAVP